MRRVLVLLAGAALAVVSLGTAAVSAPPATPGGAGLDSVPVCPGPADPDAARCHARLFVPPGRPGPQVSSAPYGLSPIQIKSAYGWTSIGDGTGKTIAIVDAYDDPTAEADLNTFSQQYGLPKTCSSTGNVQPCFAFTKVDQNGGTRYPRRDAGWALEISLDVQWAHAIAPKATILLVEASTNSFSNLLKAEDYATTKAQYVSNSWGGSEFSSETSTNYDSHFNRPTVSIFVSAGDAGLPADYPSASPYVTSVGGTTLTLNADGTAKSETGWSGGGGGCSLYETATNAQSSFAGYGQANCGGKRATPDVALDADPNSGVSVYDTTPYQGQAGWWKVGGTSASSPMWAARAAASGTLINSTYVYGSSISFRDITSGNNGAPCLSGFDLCTGRGSWTGNTP
jgi:subtilase family serine protease